MLDVGMYYVFRVLPANLFEFSSVYLLLFSL